MKKINPIILFLFLIILLYVVVDATYFSPRHTKIRKETINNEKIPVEFDGFRIVFISDLHYNSYMNRKRLEKIINKINILDPDIVLFGGDLFDHPNKTFPSEETKKELESLLKSISARHGKYAVYGNHDLESAAAKDLFEQVMLASDFKVLKNKLVTISKHTDAKINLIGLDSMLYGEVNLNQAFENSSSHSFNLVLTHTPDIFQQLNKEKADYVLAGHSHGGQIYIPLIGAIYKPEGAKLYTKGKYYESSSTLDITNGLGTTRQDIRFNAASEIVLYTLKHQ